MILDIKIQLIVELVSGNNAINYERKSTFMGNQVERLENRGKKEPSKLNLFKNSFILIIFQFYV